MIELIIDGVGYQCDSLNRIAINYDAENLKDVESGRNRIDIAATLTYGTETEALIGAEIYPHAAKKFNSEQHQGEIAIEGQTIFSGQVILDTVSWGEDGEISINFVIRSESDSWAHHVATSTFNSIDVDYKKLLVQSTIENSWSNGDPIAFFPVNWDELEYNVPNDQSYAIVNVRTVDGYHPFLHLRSLIESIYATTGYEIESNFIESKEFSNLYMSGSYAYTESSSAHARMGFCVSRTDSKSTTADSGGRVYASPYMSYNSVGSLVDYASLDSYDECFANGGSLVEEYDAVGFKPTYTTTVGFEYRFAFRATYRIKSRDELSTFNRIYVGDSTQLEFKVANIFTDRRGSDLISNFTYTICIFDHTPGRTYRVVNGDTGASLGVFTDSNFTVSVGTAPSELCIQYQLTSTLYTDFYGDWALYSGYVKAEGEMEFDLTLRSAPSQINAGTTRLFDTIIFDGAESGDSFTIMERTSIKPIFASYPGYGSYLTFDEVAKHNISQADWLSSLQHLFNLRFYTDREFKRVIIEPRDSFYCDDTWDWSERALISDGVEITNRATKAAKQRTWRYKDGDETMMQFLDCDLDEYGVWSTEITSEATSSDSKTLYNNLFYPSVNDNDNILHVGERYDDTYIDSLNFTPRIVRRDGYTQTTLEGEMPYITFHSDSTSLCFENRDGQEGLNKYYREEVQLDDQADEITLSVEISPEELQLLFMPSTTGKHPSIRSQYLIELDYEQVKCTIERIEWYDVQRGVARITFLTLD